MRLSLSRYRLRNTILATALALAGALLVFLYVQGYRDDVENDAGHVEVYVAAKDIPEGLDGPSVTGGGYLEKQTVLRRNVIRGAISSPDQIATLATTQTILDGEQVTTRQFHPVAAEGPLANISGNLRAMRLSGESDVLLAGIVKDGDHVDVLANIAYTLRAPSGSGGGDLRRVVTRIILRDLVVLRAPGDSSGGGIGGDSSTTSITLALTDQNAQKMVWATKNASWWLVLRPVATPRESVESIETIQSILSDGLGPSGMNRLTNNYGPGAISSGG